MTKVEQIKKLRHETGLGLAECKQVIELYPDILLKKHKEKMNIITNFLKQKRYEK